MNKRFLYFLILVLPALASIQAQAPSPSASAIPPPTQPYLKEPRPGSAWSVRIDYNDLPAAKPIEPESEVLAPQASEPGTSLAVLIDSQLDRSGVQRVNTKYSNGKHDEAYVFQGRMLQAVPGSKKVLNLTPDYPFPGLEWLRFGGGQFMGVEVIKDIPYYKFSVSDAYLKQNLFPPDTIFRAWVRITDSFPVRAEDNQATYLYSEVTPFSGTIALPENLKAAAQKSLAQQKTIDALRKMSGRQGQ